METLVLTPTSYEIECENLGSVKIIRLFKPTLFLNQRFAIENRIITTTTAGV